MHHFQLKAVSYSSISIQKYVVVVFVAFLNLTKVYNGVHFCSDQLDLSQSNNKHMAKELNLNMTKCTHGKMYSKICSLIIEELLDLTEVGILHITVDDYIIYVLFTSKYISNHTIDESMKGMYQGYFSFSMA